MKVSSNRGTVIRNGASIHLDVPRRRRQRAGAPLSPRQAAEWAELGRRLRPDTYEKLIKVVRDLAANDEEIQRRLDEGEPIALALFGPTDARYRRRAA